MAVVAKVAKVFLHANTGILWRVGETFRGEPWDVSQLAAMGYLERDGDARAAGPDLAALTNPELRALCMERGIELPKGRPNKAQLLTLLRG